MGFIGISINIGYVNRKLNLLKQIKIIKPNKNHQKMMQFWIGQSKQYIAAEYALSNRSTCRQCKEKIPKNQLRIGLLTDDDHMALSYWFHMNCFHFKPRHKALEKEDLVQMIYGLENLNPEDCDKVVEYLQQEFKDFLENKSGKKKSKSKITEKPHSSENDQKQQPKVEKSKKNSCIKTETAQQNPKEKNIKKSKAKTQKSKKFLSTDQQQSYSKMVEQYMKMSAIQLKEILQKNGQPKTGSKSELASACADGKMFGRIPVCPTCGGGRLRFDKQKGTYKCPGYMQDTDFIRCGANFDFDQITRTEWIQ